MEVGFEKISFTLSKHMLFQKVSCIRLGVHVTNDLPEKLNFTVDIKNGIEIDKNEGELTND